MALRQLESAIKVLAMVPTMTRTTMVELSSRHGEPQHTEAAASSSSPHAEPAAKSRHRQERDAAPAPEAMQRDQSWP